MPNQEQFVPILSAFAFSSTAIFQKFKKCLFKYNNREYVLYAGTQEYCDIIQTYITHNDEYNEVFNDLNQFLHNFGWSNHCGFQYETDAGHGSLNTNDLFQRTLILKAKRGCAINLAVDFEYTINPTNPKTNIALSLYNDAQVVNNYFYKFLCLWKILEIDYPNKKQKASEWIHEISNQNLNISHTKFIKDMIASKKDIGKYFYLECRNAVAHMDKEVKMLSFNLDDYRKIRVACSAIEPFVRYFIQNELGLPHTSKIEILAIE